MCYNKQKTELEQSKLLLKRLEEVDALWGNQWRDYSGRTSKAFWDIDEYLYDAVIFMRRRVKALSQRRDSLGRFTR